MFGVRECFGSAPGLDGGRQTDGEQDQGVGHDERVVAPAAPAERAEPARAATTATIRRPRPSIVCRANEIGVGMRPAGGRGIGLQRDAGHRLVPHSGGALRRPLLERPATCIRCGHQRLGSRPTGPGQEQGHDAGEGARDESGERQHWRPAGAARGRARRRAPRARSATRTPRPQPIPRRPRPATVNRRGGPPSPDGRVGSGGRVPAGRSASRVTAARALVRRRR